MAMVAAKCSECGASIEVNDARREGYCPFCGTKYVTQDIIQNTINNNYVTNNIGTAVIQGGDTIDAMYERFEAYIKLGDLSSSAKVVGEMREKFPQKALTWYCAALGEIEQSAEEYKCARKQIDDSVTHAFLPSAQQFPQYVFRDKDSLRQYIDEVCAGDMQKLEWRGPLRADVFKDNARQLLDAARKFETAEDRTRYAPLIRRIEEGMAGLGQKAAAFDEYVASARRELKAKVAAWKHDIEEYLLSERNRKAAEQKKMNRKYKIFRAIGIAAAVIVVVALLVDLFLGRLF